MFSEVSVSVQEDAETLHDWFGKDAAKLFLTKKAGDGDGDAADVGGSSQRPAEWVVNETVLSTALTMRARYVLAGSRMMAIRPARGSTVAFEDLSSAKDAELLLKILDYLCSDKPQATNYLMEVESRFMLQHPGTDDNCWEQTWPEVWSKVLSGAVAKASKALPVSPEMGEELLAAYWQKVLPLPRLIIPKTRQEAQGAEQRQQPVKCELGDQAPTAAAEGAANGPSSRDVLAAPRFHQIYNMTTSAKGCTSSSQTNVNVLDILSIQTQIENYLFTMARLSAILDLCWRDSVGAVAAS